MIEFTKLFLLIFGCVFAILNISAQSGESKPIDRVLFYDEHYSVKYGGNVEPAVRYFTIHGFKKMNTEELSHWLAERISGKTCAGTVVLQVSDVTSRELVEPWDKTSPLYRYCEYGGRWVAPAGNTLLAFEGADDFTIMLQNQYTKDSDKFLTNCFGVHRIYGLRGKGERVVTAEGKKWGLDGDASKWMKFLMLGVPAADVTPLVEAPANKVALVWRKNITPDFPGSGLVGLCVGMSENESLLEMIYKLCVADGKEPVTVPKIEWKEKKAIPDLAIEFPIFVDVIPRRAFQRGEKIPLAIHAFGKKLKGRALTARLSLDGVSVWRKTWPEGKRDGLRKCENIDSALFKCGEYELEGFVDDQKVAEEKLWICPVRRNNSFPLLTCKMHRKNPIREQLALKYLRDRYVNGMIFDLYQLEGADKNPATAKLLGRYLDLLLRNNLNASARPTAMNMFTDKKDEELVLYDGSVHSHGVNHDAMSWRAFRAYRLDSYREKLRKQVTVLKNSKSPVIVPYFTTNDDGSMGGNYDFNPLTMQAFQEKTGLTRKQLPPLKEMKDGNHVFMPVVAPGVVLDNHPWLEYFRFHCGNYNAICQAAMEGVESAWPGSLVADSGCMSGPLYIPRGYYPPLSARAYNTASFYQYLFWLHAYPFAMEAARMGNREKPVGLIISASLIAWGPVFQRATLYRILAEAPEFIALWSLDARRMERYDREEHTWEGTRSVAEKVAKVATFMKKQKTIPAKGALFFGLAQNCFNLNDKNLRPYYMRTALENFLYAGAKLDLICTREVLDGSLDSYEVVFVNGHQWITQGAKKTLEDYIKNGGVVIVDSETTLEIEGVIKADGPFGTGLDDLGAPDRVKRCRKYVDQYLKPRLIRSISENTVVRANKVDDTPLVWVIDVESTTDSAALREAQSKEWETGVYDYLNEKAAKNPISNKTIEIEFGWHAYDLWNGRELATSQNKLNGWKTVDVPVECLSAVPVALYRDRIEELRFRTATKSITPGDGFCSFFELVSENGTPVRGVVPAQVTVYDPAGNEVWEYGGNALIENGIVAVKFTTAVNDIIGKWKVAVRELASRREVSVEFKLETIQP